MAPARFPARTSLRPSAISQMTTTDFAVRSQAPCTMVRRRCLSFASVAALLAVVAATSGSPQSTDRDVYEQIGGSGAALDCVDIHCFRPLVAVIVEHLPGPSLVRWRAYAVVTSAAAAVAL